MVKNKYISKMFIDYDHCNKNGIDKYCKDCTEKQQAKCQKKNE